MEHNPAETLIVRSVGRKVALTLFALGYVVFFAVAVKGADPAEMWAPEEFQDSITPTEVRFYDETRSAIVRVDTTAFEAMSEADQIALATRWEEKAKIKGAERVALAGAKGANNPPRAHHGSK